MAYIESRHQRLVLCARHSPVYATFEIRTPFVLASVPELYIAQQQGATSAKLVTHALGVRRLRLLSWGKLLTKNCWTRINNINNLIGSERLRCQCPVHRTGDPFRQTEPPRSWCGVLFWCFTRTYFCTSSVVALSSAVGRLYLSNKAAFHPTDLGTLFLPPLLCDSRDSSFTRDVASVGSMAGRE